MRDLTSVDAIYKLQILFPVRPSSRPSPKGERENSYRQLSCFGASSDPRSSAASILLSQ